MIAYLIMNSLATQRHPASLLCLNSKNPESSSQKKRRSYITSSTGHPKSQTQESADSTKVTLHHCKPVAHNGMHSPYDCRDGNARVPSRLVSELLTKKSSQGDVLTRRTNGWQPFQTCPTKMMRQSTQFKAPRPKQKAVATTSH